MKLTVFAAAIALAALGGAAAAEPEAPVVRVAYADLDLTDPADAREMLQRIRDAAAATCRDARKASSGPAAETFEYCRAHVERDAVRRLKAPAVRQAYLRPAPVATPMLADAR